jgi:two-component system, response regulator
MNGEHKIEILLVEDNTYDAELTIEALKERKLINHIHHAKDGAAALEYLFETDGSLKKETPVLILLDLKLPKVSGLEVLHRVKSHDRAKSIPVVVLTSSNQDSDIEECYRLGANSFITKPVEFEKFSKAVEDLGYYWLLLNKTSG